MLPDTPSVSQLSHVISQATAPAFMLGSARCLYRAADCPSEQDRRSNHRPKRHLDDNTAKGRLKADLPRLMRRAAMMNRAILWAVIRSIAITVLVILAFCGRPARAAMGTYLQT